MRQAWWDQWTPVDSRRWGVASRIAVPAGALDITTEELCRIEAPQPCIWRVMLQVDGLDAADAATARFVLDIGVGSAVATIQTDAFGVPGTPPSGEFPASTIVGRVRLQSAAVLAARSVKVVLWAAPVIPWVGLQFSGR